MTLINYIDIKGQLVLENKIKITETNEGNFIFRLDIPDISSGIYNANVKSEQYEVARKIIIQK